MFAHFGSKIAKSDYFRGFYFSQSLSHILGNNITSVFLREWKLKFCLRSSIFWPLGSQNVGPCWVKNSKKAIFIPATSSPIQFSLKHYEGLIFTETNHYSSKWKKHAIWKSYRDTRKLRSKTAVNIKNNW